MKTLALVVPIGLCLALQVVALADQQEVFVTRGAGGPVYSDKPQPGAKPVNLPELNVVQPVPVPRATVPQAIQAPDEARHRAAAASAYHRFSIVFPEDHGSVAANTALFEVRVAIEPALQLGEGHAITVSINGRPVGQRFTATEFMISPEFWGDTLPPANQPHQVDAAIVDRTGTVIRRAEPVTFHLRHIEFRRHWPGPRREPLPVPVQRPRPPAPLPQKSPVLKDFDPPGPAFFRDPPAGPAQPPRQ
jgi:hypothetical protein